MSGRRPKPTALHLLNGNPSKLSKEQLENAGEPSPSKGAPEQPRGLSKAARREWRKIVPELLALGVLSNIDGKALAAYCEAYALWEMACKEYQAAGAVTITTHFQTREGETVIGDMKPHPAVAISLNAAKVMKAFLIEFGLTPASRRNLKVTKKPELDPMESFQRRRPSAAPVLLTPQKPPQEA